MRLLTRHIHRAFPELDSYDDAQCRRFIKAAQSGPHVWILHKTAILAVTLPLLIVGIWLSAWASDSLEIYSFSHQSFQLWLRIALWMLATACCLAPALVAGYLTRDVLLRRRLHAILRTSGGCPRCSYSIIGLPLMPNGYGGSTVRCPECGAEVEVDPSLAELVKLPSGSHLRGESPSSSSFPAHGTGLATGQIIIEGVRVNPKVFWSPKRKRLAARATIALIAAVALIAGTNELFIRWQAGTARQALAKAQADYLALADKGYAAAGIAPSAAVGRSLWDQFDDAALRISTIDGPTWRDTPYGSSPRIYPDFGAIANPQASMRDASTPEALTQQQDAIDLARSLIPIYNKSGAFEPLRGVGSNLNVRLPDSMLSVDLRRANFSIIGRQREVCRVLGGRMAMAAQAANREEFLESLEAILAMAQLAQVQPHRMIYLSGVSYEYTALENLRVLLVQGHIKPAWLPEIQAIIARQRCILPFDHALQGDQLIATGTIAAFFAVPDNTRLGRYSKPFQRALPSNGRGMPAVGFRTMTLGTFAENLRALDAIYADALPILNAEAWQRGSIPPAAVPPTTLGLVSTNATPLLLSSTLDALAANRRGLDTYLALERFHADTGTYPASLAEIVPTYITAVPIDPWTGNDILYRRFAPGGDSDKRPFVLYFTGSDASDDGGIGAGPGQRFWSQMRDHVVNDPNR